MSKLLRRTLEGLGGLLVIGLAVAWLSGYFEARVAPGEVEPAAGPALAAAELVAVEKVTAGTEEWASGALASARQTAVSARILARIEAVHVTAGDEVKQGDLLIELDARDFQSRLNQAGDALRGATARLELAQAEKDRAESLLAKGTGTRQRLEQATAELRGAQAEVARLKQQREEAATGLSYAEIRAPSAGRVIDRFAEPGDTASPGQVLIRLYDPKLLRVEVPVRESLAVHLAVGQSLPVEVSALARSLEGKVDEIVPFAEPGARTLLVKVGLPADPALVAGLFARVAVPAGEASRLLIPETAVERIGQLTFVTVAGASGGSERRLVTLGRADGPSGSIEVLSGLAEGERVLRQASGA